MSTVITENVLATVVKGYTDKGYKMTQAATNAASIITRDARNVQCIRSTYLWGLDNAGVALSVIEATNDLIVVAKIPERAEVLWDKVAIVSNGTTGNADDFSGSLGFVDAAGTYTAKTTFGVATANVHAVAMPEYVDEDLSTERYLIAKILCATPPVATAITGFYIPYIGLN